jgi:hypothetical protein
MFSLGNDIQLLILLYKNTCFHPPYGRLRYRMNHQADPVEIVLFDNFLQDLKLFSIQLQATTSAAMNPNTPQGSDSRPSVRAG